MAKCSGNLSIYQGNDWAALVCICNHDGTPADLTGYTAQAQIREGVADQAWGVEAQMLSAVVLPNGISLSLTNRQTSRLRQPTYRWDLQLISAGGIITTVAAGTVKVTFAVTRPPYLESAAPGRSYRDGEAEEALWRDSPERYLMAVEEGRWGA